MQLFFEDESIDLCRSESNNTFVITSEREARSEFLLIYTKNLSMSGRPAGRGHAFERLISLEPKARLTSGLLWWVPPSLLPCMGPMPNHASTHCGTWRVLPGGMSQMFHLLFLGNVWADCVENLACIRGPISYSLCSSHGWGISARAHAQRYPPHRASVSQKRLDRLCSNLVCGLGVIS